MATLTLPARARPLIGLSIFLQVAALYLVVRHPHAGFATAVLAIVLSSFIADALTALAHFGFDYVFRYQTPVLGPIAREFHEHHENPTLDPASYVENLTKGAYASLPTLGLLLLLLACLAETSVSFIVETAVMGISVWAFFFHQIHAYAHMSSSLPAVVFNRSVAEISKLRSAREQKQAFEQLFRTVPIPPAIRLLQRCHLILNPARHNLHHLRFESDFSSANGWSDPVLNPLLGKVAQRFKASQQRGGAGRRSAGDEPACRPTGGGQSAAPCARARPGS
jgi:hypothetical protein